MERKRKMAKRIRIGGIKKAKTGKSATEGKWKLEGFDTFEGSPYPLPGEYNNEEEARRVAKARLKELEKRNPSETSGGQGATGIQDRVFIVRPDGSKYRYLP